MEIKKLNGIDRCRGIAYFSIGEELYLYRVDAQTTGLSWSYWIFRAPMPERMPHNPCVALWWREIATYRATYAPHSVEAAHLIEEHIRRDYVAQATA